MSSSHKILSHETDILKIMEKSLETLPTPPNPEKENLLREIQNLRKKIDEAMREFQTSTEYLQERFITLSKREIQQAEQGVCQKIQASLQLENPIHLEKLAQQLDKQIATFQKVKQPRMTKTPGRELATMNLNRLFSTQSLPQTPKVKTIPLERRLR